MPPADIVWGKDEPMPPDEIDKVRDDVEVIIAGAWRHGDVSCFPKLRAILEVSGGFPSPQVLDYEACFSRGIRVLSCAPAFGPAVAEMGLGLALACARQIAWTDTAFRYGEPNWSHTKFPTEIGDTFTLYGKQVGLIGFGGLARALLPLLKPFGCPIQVYDPWLTPAYLRTQGVTPVDLDTLLATSRFIFVLAVPGTGNKAFLSREKLNLIRRDAVFLLLSRAHVVDFDALTELLAAGPLPCRHRRLPAGAAAQGPSHPARQACRPVVAPGRCHSTRGSRMSAAWSPTISRRSAAISSPSACSLPNPSLSACAAETVSSAGPPPAAACLT